MSERIENLIIDGYRGMNTLDVNLNGITVLTGKAINKSNFLNDIGLVVEALKTNDCSKIRKDIYTPCLSIVENSLCFELPKEDFCASVYACDEDTNVIYRPLHMYTKESNEFKFESEKDFPDIKFINKPIDEDLLLEIANSDYSEMSVGMRNLFHSYLHDIEVILNEDHNLPQADSVYIRRHLDESYKDFLYLTPDDARVNYLPMLVLRHLISYGVDNNTVILLDKLFDDLDLDYNKINTINIEDIIEILFELHRLTGVNFILTTNSPIIVRAIEVMGFDYVNTVKVKMIKFNYHDEFHYPYGWVIKRLDSMRVSSEYYGEYLSVIQKQNKQIESLYWGI